MPSTDVKLTFKGPIFTPKGAELLKRHMGGAVQTMIEKGEERLSTMLRPRPAGVYLSVGEAQKGKASTGHYRRMIHGTRQGLNGRISDGGVVYGPWLETGSATGRFKGYAAFRKVGQWLQANKDKIIKVHVTRLVRELRGGI